MSEDIYYCNPYLKTVEGVEGAQDGHYWAGSVAIACLHPDCFRKHQAFQVQRAESVEHATDFAKRRMEEDCRFVGTLDEMTVIED